MPMLCQISSRARASLKKTLQFSHIQRMIVNPVHCHFDLVRLTMTRQYLQRIVIYILYQMFYDIIHIVLYFNKYLYINDRLLLSTQTQQNHHHFCTE